MLPSASTIHQSIYTLTPSGAEFEYRYAEKDLRVFTQAAWRVANPFVPFQPNWHLDAICDHLMGVSLGHIRRLVINMPPRHAKSTITSVMWPAWEWIQWPHIKSIYSAYKEQLALRDSVATRRLIESPWYQKRWADRFMLVGDQNAKKRFDNDMSGSRLVCSFEAGPGGEGGDKVVVDDPLDPDEQTNIKAVERVNEKWDTVYTTRLNDPQRGSFVIIMQRLHDQDLSGHVFEQGGWMQLVLPAEYDPRRHCVTMKGAVRPVEPELAEKTPWGKQREIKPRNEKMAPWGYRRFDYEDPREEEGELLWPTRFGPEQITEKRREMTAWAFSGQFNQDPVPKDATLFPADLWQYWSMPPVQERNGTPAFDDWLQSWDCAFKDLEDSDYVVGQVWAKRGPNFYLIDQIRGQMGFGKTVKAVEELSLRWPQAKRILIEDKANGTAVIETLKAKMSGIIAVEPNGGKISRAFAVQHLHEGKNIFLPVAIGVQWPVGLKPKQTFRTWTTDWVVDFVKECTRFPKGGKDDQVDAMTQALIWWVEKMKGLTAVPLSLGEQVNTWSIT